MLRFGFEEIGFARVLAISDADNHASIAVMRRLGMTLENRFAHAGREHARSVLAREAFRPHEEPYVMRRTNDGKR